MNTTRAFAPGPYSIRGIVSLLATLITTATPAATIWNGPIITYSQPGTDPTQAANQDRLTPNVWLTRANHDRLFNAVTETFCSRGISPTDTEWASGTLANHASLTYHDFSTWVDGLGSGHVNPKILNVDAVLHLKSEDIYLSIKFTGWGAFGSGHFTYQRSTAAPAPPVPTVNLTSPTNGQVFVAPATVTLTANATVSGGSVTNVGFFVNGALAGNDPSNPFSTVTGSLAAGNYALTAVATAGGISATSAVVTITVGTPPPGLSAPLAGNNQFTFDYTANPGLSYVVESSSNLVNWIPLATNVAASSPVHFTNNIIPNGSRYFRVGRLP